MRFDELPQTLEDGASLRLHLADEQISERIRDELDEREWLECVPPIVAQMLSFMVYVPASGKVCWGVERGDAMSNFGRWLDAQIVIRARR